MGYVADFSAAFFDVNCEQEWFMERYCPFKQAEMEEELAAHAIAESERFRRLFFCTTTTTSASKALTDGANAADRAGAPIEQDEAEGDEAATVTTITTTEVAAKPARLAPLIERMRLNPLPKGGTSSAEIDEPTSSSSSSSGAAVAEKSDAMVPKTVDAAPLAAANSESLIIVCNTETADAGGNAVDGGKDTGAGVGVVVECDEERGDAEAQEDGGRHLLGHTDRCIYVTGIDAECPKAVFKAAVIMAISDRAEDLNALLPAPPSGCEYLPIVQRVVVSQPVWNHKGRFERSAWVVLNSKAPSHVAAVLGVLKDLVVNVPGPINPETGELDLQYISFPINAQQHIPKVHVVPANVSSGPRVTSDELAARRLAGYLDLERGVPENQRLHRVLTSVIEPLWEQQRQRETEGADTVAGTESPASSLVLQPTDALDVAIAYLRRVHFVTFYEGKRFRNEAHLLSMCPHVMVRDRAYYQPTNSRKPLAGTLASISVVRGGSHQQVSSSQVAASTGVSAAADQPSASSADTAGSRRRARSCSTDSGDEAEGAEAGADAEAADGAEAEHTEHSSTFASYDSATDAGADPEQQQMPQDQQEEDQADLDGEAEADVEAGDTKTTEDGVAGGGSTAQSQSHSEPRRRPHGALPNLSRRRMDFIPHVDRRVEGMLLELHHKAYNRKLRAYFSKLKQQEDEAAAAGTAATTEDLAAPSTSADAEDGGAAKAEGAPTPPRKVPRNVKVIPESPDVLHARAIAAEREAVLQKWAAAHVEELTDQSGKARCKFKWCPKLFRGAEFVVKHVRSKHSELAASLLAACSRPYMWERYMRESIGSRPLPTMPLETASGVEYRHVEEILSRCNHARNLYLVGWTPPAAAADNRSGEPMDRGHGGGVRAQQQQQRQPFGSKGGKNPRDHQHQKPKETGDGGQKRDFWSRRVAPPAPANPSNRALPSYVDMDAPKATTTELDYGGVSLMPPPKKRKLGGGRPSAAAAAAASPSASAAAGSATSTKE